MTNPDLAALSGAATQGPWAVCTDATGDTFVASLTDSAETICEFGAGCDDDAQESLNADAALIVALVNAYRSGDLVQINREGLREELKGVFDAGWEASEQGLDRNIHRADAVQFAIAAMLGEKS